MKTSIKHLHGESPDVIAHYRKLFPDSFQDENVSERVLALATEFDSLYVAFNKKADELNAVCKKEGVKTLILDNFGLWKSK